MNFLSRESYSHTLFLPQNYNSIGSILRGMDGKFQSEPLKEFKRTEENEPKPLSFEW